MVIDVFTQHRHPGVIQVIVGLHFRNLPDQVLGSAVFDFGLVQQSFPVDGLAHLRVKNILLDLGMNCEFLANLRGKLALFICRCIVVAQFFVSSEQFFDGDMVGIEQVNRIIFLCWGFGHGVS